TAIVRELKTNMTIHIRLGDIEDKTYAARITEISPDIENNTTYGVTSALEASDAFLRAGMDGEASINLPKADGDSIAIPLSCILASADGSRYLWIAEPQADGKTATVVKRKVTLGMLGEEGTVYVESGLQPGERVISRGVHRVEEGLTVTLMDAS
ncbi:MAG: hypothetical protein O7C75_05440, partial [Verrucomicrobia bacterium]|nr:hypothetical protein [Verrucomicrobiota bacterium]